MQKAGFLMTRLMCGIEAMVIYYQLCVDDAIVQVFTKVKLVLLSYLYDDEEADRLYIL